MRKQPDGDVVSIERGDDGALVLTGDVDMASSPLLDAAFLDHPTDRSLVLDMSGVSFMDSSGLRSLLAATRRGTVVLRDVGPEVARLLDITGTTSLFVIESSHERG